MCRSYYTIICLCVAEHTEISHKAIENLMVTTSLDWDVEWKELIFCVAFLFNVHLRSNILIMHPKCDSEQSIWIKTIFLPLSHNKFLHNSFWLDKRSLKSNKKSFYSIFFSFHQLALKIYFTIRFLFFILHTTIYESKKS